MLRKITVGVIFFQILNPWGFAYEDDTIELGEIVITPLRFEESSMKIPASTEVITREEIKESKAQSVVDVLRNKTGIIVRDYFGTAVQSSVDMRGFGETGAMNTLVLVDGRRVNNIDLSGTSWTQIPLEKIEKIEIIRGLGSVLYGDNAAGGVINIITRKGEGKPTFTINTQGGSFRMNRQNFLCEGSKNALSYSLGFTNYSTRGYRQNSEYKGVDSWTRLIYDITDGFSLTINGNYHNAEFGLPGALRESQLQTLSRKETVFPEDHVAEEDWYVDIGLKKDFNECGIIQTNTSFRRRKVENKLLSSFNIDGRRIDTLGIRSQYILDREVFDRENKFTAGIDFYRSDSLIDAYSYIGLLFYDTGQKVSETDIDRESLGLYIQDIFSITDNLTFTGGFRHEKAKYDFNFRQLPGPWTLDVWFFPIAPIDGDITIEEKALNFGLNYLLSDNASVFINYSRGFRFGVSDEYYSVFAAPPINTNLKPQTSHNYEFGMNTEFFSKLTASLTVFMMKLNNEIFYNPLTFANQNYDDTEHRGIELGLELKLNDTFKIKGDYLYTKAFFDGGLYNRNQIPLVPYHKASLGLETDLMSGFKLDIIAGFVGKRYFISDQPHNYPKMDDYTTLSMKLSYEFKNLNVFFKVNNLLNKKYSEMGAISLMSGERGYYPSPERNFIGGVSYKF